MQTAESASDFSQSEVEAEALQRFAQSLESQAATDNSIEGEKSGTISAAVFDWNDDFVGDQYDVVIACDVLYETLAPEALARLLPTMLAGPAQDGRRILLTDPQDRTPKHRENFFKLLARDDPSIVCEWVKTIEVEHPTASGAPVKVLSIAYILLEKYLWGLNLLVRRLCACVTSGVLIQEGIQCSTQPKRAVQVISLRRRIATDTIGTSLIARLTPALHGTDRRGRVLSSR